MKTVLVVFVTLAVLGSAGSALAATKSFCQTVNNSWSGIGNWEELDVGEVCGEGTPTGIPTAADRAVIVSGKTCNVDISNAEADTLVVETTATLNIQIGSTVTLRNASGEGSTIDGTLNLESGFGTVPELVFEINNHTLAGDGKIVGQNEIAKFRILDAIEVISQITIEGKLTFTDENVENIFNNQGVVHANTDGAIHIQVSTMLDTANAVGEDARWQVSHVSGTLWIDVNSHTHPPPISQTLAGDFDVSEGTVDVDWATTTTGDLTMTAGRIDASDARITFSG